MPVCQDPFVLSAVLSVGTELEFSLGTKQNLNLRPDGFIYSFTTLMVYKIPMDDVKSLAMAFSELESGESLLNTPQHSHTVVMWVTR